MTSEPAAADYFTTGAFMQKKHGGRLNLRYSEGNISCRTLPIVERKAALDTQGHMRSPDIEYFTAERPDFSSQYHFNASSFFLERSLLVSAMKRLNVGVLWPIGLVLLMIDSSVQQQRAGKESGKGRFNIYVVCDPKNLCEFSPCHNGGSCEPISNSDRTPGFRCRCGSGFRGEICLDSKYRSLCSALWRQNLVKRGKLLTSTTAIFKAN